MKKEQLLKLKDKLLIILLASTILSSIGCQKKKKHYTPPQITSITESYSQIKKYYKYIKQDNKTVKAYESKYVYLLYNKETIEVKEYIYNNKSSFAGGFELYDLKTETLLSYYNGISIFFNEDYLKYLIENNYQINLANIGEYIDDFAPKEYYTKDEIKTIENIISNTILNNNEAKTKS